MQLGRELSGGSAPARIAGLAGARALAVGIQHSCALLDDGTVRCWGTNGQGQLGNGVGAAGSAAPVAVADITGATAISSGLYHVCAMVAGGSLRCWGQNQDGQLGNGTLTGSSKPVAVTGLTEPVSVFVAGYFHTCAVLSGGGVRCWGDNLYGQLGNGTRKDVTTPTAVGSLAGATTIAAGRYLTCARLSDGTAQCWGTNAAGQLGQGYLDSAPLPVPVAANW
jgi:alpha-tubulin suppressor-like RCC1 family protein